MDIPSTILRALDAFEGDVRSGVIEASIADIDAARAWMTHVQFVWNQVSGAMEASLQLQYQVALAHSVPHEHEVNGKVVGHNRLRAVSALRNPPRDVTCGLQEPHPPHQWEETDLRFACPGRDPDGKANRRDT